jgi:hypothetical protein
MAWRTTTVLFVILCLSTSISHAQLRWKSFANLRLGRHWHAVRYLAGDRAIVMGGYVDSRGILDGTPTNQTEIVDLSSGTVVDGPPMRYARAEFPTLVLPDGDILVFGGFSNDAGGTIIERLDIRSMTWSVEATMQSARRQHAADFLSPDEILIFAGFGNSSAEILNLKTWRTQRVRALPTQANSAVSVNPDGRGPSYFGFREGGPNSARSKTSLRYMRSTDLWEQDLVFDESPVAPGVTALNDGSVVVVAGALTESPFTASPYTWVVNPLGVVRKGPTLEVGRQHIGIGTWSNSRVLTAGGIASGVVISNVCEWIDIEKGVVERGPDLVQERLYAPMIMAPSRDGRMRAFVFSGLSENSNTALIEVLEDSACSQRVARQELSRMRTVGAARFGEMGLALTTTGQYESGGAFIDKRIAVRNGFDLRFSFRLSQGNDNGMVDNGDPGADGIAVVFLPENPTALGRAGDGIGYHEIPHGMAVEYDAYLNPAFSDPNTSHVAVQVGDGQMLRAWHMPPYLRGIATTGVPSFKADGSVYYGRIHYTSGRLSVYVSTTGTFTSPVIEIDSFDLQTVLNLDSRGSCYVGFTSSTGRSSEIHELLSVEVTDCQPLVSSAESDSDPLASESAYAIITPNPSGSSCELRFAKELAGEAALDVVDPQGRLLRRELLARGTQSIELCSGEHLAAGSYVVRVVCNGQIWSSPFVILP